MEKMKNMLRIFLRLRCDIGKTNIKISITLFHCIFLNDSLIYIDLNNTTVHFDHELIQSGFQNDYNRYNTGSSKLMNSHN